MRRSIVVNRQFSSKIKSIKIYSYSAISSKTNGSKKLPNKKLVSTKPYMLVNNQKSKNKDIYDDYCDSNDSHITYGLPNYFVKKNRLSINNDTIESNNNCEFYNSELDDVSDD